MPVNMRCERESDCRHFNLETKRGTTPETQDLYCFKSVSHDWLETTYLQNKPLQGAVTKFFKIKSF